MYMELNRGNYTTVDPRALARSGGVFRCDDCRCLVLNDDRDEHICAAPGVTDRLVGEVERYANR